MVTQKTEYIYSQWIVIAGDAKLIILGISCLNFSFMFGVDV